MSADNGVYILESQENGTIEYRVTAAAAIENIFWNTERHTEGSQFNMEEVRNYWGSSKVYTTAESVLMEAYAILKSLSICEYGISTFELPGSFYSTEKYVG